MPPSLALILCLIFLFYFLKIDKSASEGVSKAIIIPFLWMCLGGSRYAGHWLNPAGSLELSAYAEGSPVDRAVFLFLIIAGILVLYRRKLPWNDVFKNNIWVWLYFLYGLISIAWADLPFVAFKRWIKGVGTVIMVLIILTEIRPYKSLENILRKMVFILLPLSVLFINYFPHLGRAYHMGRPMYLGVAGQKNGLGMLCLVSAIYFCWMFLYRPIEHSTALEKIRLALNSVMVLMTAWLMSKADSATALICMFIAIIILLLYRTPSFKRNPQRNITIFLVILFFVFSIEALFGVKDNIIALLGREPSLTTRVPMWKDLISMVRNPILGFGYDSFWLGERQQYIYENWGISHSAHNGYLEMYLNLGLMGVLFIAAWIISGIGKIKRYLHVDYAAGVLRFTIIVIAAIYNYTEATFYGVSLMWVLLFLGIMDPPSMSRAGRPSNEDSLETNLNRD